MEAIRAVNSNFDLKGKIVELAEYYEYFDGFVQRMSGGKQLRIRQITEVEDLERLSEARKRMYGQRDAYFSKLYKGQYYIDELDLNSYVFACFYEDEIIAIQRAACYPFEVATYISDEKLLDYFGEDYQTKYLEFSRLVVDKDARIRGLSNLIGFVAGALSAIGSGREYYFTYTKPRLKRGAFEFDEKMLTFKIDERDGNEYQIFKGAVLTDLKRTFSVEGDSTQEAIGNLRRKMRL